jgi:hypothetical protein
VSWSPLSAGARHVLAGETMSARLVPICLPQIGAAETESYVPVNGAVAFASEAGKLGEDRAPQAKLLGVVHDGEPNSFAEELIARKI